MLADRGDAGRLLPAVGKRVGSVDIGPGCEAGPGPGCEQPLGQFTHLFSREGAFSLGGSNIVMFLLTRAGRSLMGVVLVLGDGFSEFFFFVFVVCGIGKFGRAP